MKWNRIILLSAVTISFTACSFTACGQTKKQQKDNTSKQTKNQSKINRTESKMDLSKITNEKVRQAVDAQISGDKATFFSLFTGKVKFTDDGNTLDFKSFFENAFNHKEQFLSIDKVENNGKDIFGRFNAGQWGTFNVYFKFHQNADGQFDELHIGNMDK